MFVPFVADAEPIRRLVTEIEAPVNILGSPRAPTLPKLAALGVIRVSIGGAFSRMIYARVREAAAELRDRGTYGFMSGDISHQDLNKLLAG